MDIPLLTIAELGRAYDRREVSPVEATRALLDRIAAHDAKLDSFIRVTEDVALAEAKTAEAELMAGRRRGPMHGIPYGLKDIVETAGIPTTGHSKLRQHHVPKADAEIVRRLKAGGGVLVGKLATWEFATMAAQASTCPGRRRATRGTASGCPAARRAVPARRWRRVLSRRRSVPTPAARSAARLRCAASPG
jgi:Asp-tRNA(Asn)/Glu-tRNA(Gln) amidotransferase A subunit family amidase